MDDYKIMEPPFSLKFREMSKKELDEYFNWYIDQIPERIRILEKLVKLTPGYENWKANYLPDSLDKLGEWFDSQIETRIRTDAEIEEKQVGLSWPLNQIEIQKWDLTDKTFSLAIDIGMYVSQVLLKNISSLEWQHTTKGSKRWVDYGQPVLTHTGCLVFNPVRQLIVLAYGLVKHTRKSNFLREIFEIEKKCVDEYVTKGISPDS